MFITRTSHRSSGNDTSWNRKKYNKLVLNLEILDRSKWPKETEPCFGDEQVCELAKNWTCVRVTVSVHEFLDYFISVNCDNFPGGCQRLASAMKHICNTHCTMWAVVRYHEH
jgi:hypothetical protein